MCPVCWCKYQGSAEPRSWTTTEFSHSAGGPQLELRWGPGRAKRARARLTNFRPPLRPEKPDRKINSGRRRKKNRVQCKNAGLHHTVTQQTLFCGAKKKNGAAGKKKLRGTVPLRAQRAENFCYHREKVTFFPPLLQQKNFFLGFRSGPPPNLRQKNTFSRHCYKKKVFSRILA